MDRLTEVAGKTTHHYALKEGVSVEFAIGRLARYEDAEEQGRMVILPCKVGDTVYRMRCWG